MIRIVLAEDQTLLRGALAALLSLEDDIQVVATASDAASAFDAVLREKPDLVLTDIEMPGGSGLELADRLRRLPSPPKTVILTTFARRGYHSRATEVGAAGYLLKDMPSEELVAILRRIVDGENVVAPALAGSPEKEETLSPREQQVLRLAEQGCSNKEIASQLSLSAGTVRNYLAEASQKLGVRNRVEAFRTARERGLL